MWQLQAIFFEILLRPKITQNEITYPDIDGPTYRAIIDYCYTGHIEISVENVRKILAAAVGMKISFVKEKCCKYLYGEIVVENCVATFLDMDKYESNQRKASLQFICRNFDKISIDNILMLNIDQFTEVIGNEKVKGTESFIFGRVKEWIELNDIVEIGDKVPNLLSSIRLNCIDSKVCSVYEYECVIDSEN